MKRVIAAFALMTATPTVPQAFDVAPMSEEELDESRGGFSLPGGIIVNIGVTTDTRVDGQEVLRTILAIDGAGSRVQVLGAQQGGALSDLQVTPDGAAVATRDGVVRLRGGPDGTRVQLASNGLDVTHLVGGGALGTIIANTADNRTIEVSTSVDIGLSGIRPDQIGGSMAQVEGVALGSTAGLVRF